MYSFDYHVQNLMQITMPLIYLKFYLLIQFEYNFHM